MGVFRVDAEYESDQEPCIGETDSYRPARTFASETATTTSSSFFTPARYACGYIRPRRTKESLVEHWVRSTLTFMREDGD